MRKVLVDCLVILVTLGFPLAVLLALPEMHSLGLLSILPISVVIGIFVVRNCTEEFFFERWIEKFPAVGRPLLAALVLTIIFAEVRIVIGSKGYELNIPNPQATPKEIQQALSEEFPEFN